MSRAIPEVRPRIRAHITWLEQELKDLEGDLRGSIRSSTVWGKRTNSRAVFPALVNRYP